MTRNVWVKGKTLSLALAAVLSSFPAWGAVEGSFDRTLNVTGPVELEVRTGSGSIQVMTGSGGSVRIIGRIKAGWGLFSGTRDAEEAVRRLEQNPPIEQTGNAIVVGAAKQPDWLNNISISYEITAPPETRVRASTGSGSQVIEGVKGPVEARTGSGGIRVARVVQEVEARTGSGHIQLEGVGGAVRLETGSGGIRASDLGSSATAHTGSGSIDLVLKGEGDVEARTGSGGVRVMGVSGGMDASTSSGSIEVEGKPASLWKLHTSSGGIRVQVPPGSTFDLRARTGSGTITVDHPVTVQGVIDRKKIEGKAGAGGPLVELNTSSGSIHIR